MFKQHNFENNVKDKCSLKAVTLYLTVIIFSFIIHIKNLITRLFQKLIYEIQNNLHQLTTHMSTLIMWHNRFSENENQAMEAHIPRHRDSKTKKPQH